MDNVFTHLNERWLSMLCVPHEAFSSTNRGFSRDPDARRILTKGAVDNNRGDRVIHSLLARESWVFHIIHRFRTTFEDAQRKTAESRERFVETVITRVTCTLFDETPLTLPTRRGYNRQAQHPVGRVLLRRTT